MELLHVQGPKSNIKAVGDYFRADGPFEGKNGYSKPDLRYSSNIWTSAIHKIGR
jgi:hypothetical protein